MITTMTFNSWIELCEKLRKAKLPILKKKLQEFLEKPDSAIKIVRQFDDMYQPSLMHNGNLSGAGRVKQEGDYYAPVTGLETITVHQIPAQMVW